MSWTPSDEQSHCALLSLVQLHDSARFATRLIRTRNNNWRSRHSETYTSDTLSSTPRLCGLIQSTHVGAGFTPARAPIGAGSTSQSRTIVRPRRRKAGAYIVAQQ